MTFLTTYETASGVQPPTVSAIVKARLDHFDLFGDAARKTQKLGIQCQTGDVLNRSLVLVCDRRHSCLDPVYTQRIELPCNRHLLVAAEDDRGLLLAITQRNVMDLYVRRKVVVVPHLRQIAPGAHKPFVRFPGVLHGISKIDEAFVHRCLRGSRPRSLGAPRW